MFRALFLLFPLILITESSFGQTNASEEPELAKLEFYSKANPNPLLFVHTDKTVYTNNETIWFSGYLMCDNSTIKDHSILSVALMREDNRKIPLHNKYVMESGLAFGSLTLPDSIPPGNYQFLASTNVLDKQVKPIALFAQPITIKSITHQDFQSELTLLDTALFKDAIRAKITVNVSDYDVNDRISVKYSVGKAKQESITLKKGERTHLITVPKAHLNQFQPTLLTSIQYKKNIQHLSVKLPELKPKGIHLGFFPEGGHLVEGLQSLIALETKTMQNLPVSVSVILFKNDLPVDTFTTNSYGTGAFKLIPEAGSHYSAKIDANIYLDRDTVYHLPNALTDGITLHVSEAIVNDTLRLSFSSKKAQTVRVLIHNYRKPFASFNILAQPIVKKVSVALGPLIPKGIGTITVLDEAGRPLAERLFFAHYDKRITTEIKPDKPVYNRKEKVNVNLKLADITGSSVPGIVSIAVVQDNRVEGFKSQDIETYAYLNHTLGALPQFPQGRGIRNNVYLENMLLVKGWRKYSWQNMMKNSDIDLETHIPVIRGTVRYSNKPLKKPVELISLRDSSMRFIITGNDGSFVLSPDNSLTKEGRHVLLMVNKNVKEGYTVNVENPFVPINEKLAENAEIYNYGIAQPIQTSKDQQLKGFERVIALQTVVISDKGGDNLLYNACGDYVCTYNILNCPNHYRFPNNRAPVVGEVYKDGSSGGAKITYRGCTGENNIVFKINGIYTAREFYGVNTDAAGMVEPQFLSTLFWAPGVVPNTNGETEFSFFTGDITGKFRIVVQGVSENDMIFGESHFTVK